MVQVSSNGFFSFDREVATSSPRLFQMTHPHASIVAPFWAKNDITSRVGSISYEIHDSISSDHIRRVSSFISHQQEVKFEGTWMIVAEWSDVSQFNSSVNDSDVSKLTASE